MMEETLATNVRDVLDLHKRLVAFPSLSHEEGPIADFVAAYVQDSGLPVHRMEDNIWFTLGTGEDGLLLATHLDVVPPSATHPFPPFEATLHEGHIYGRGTVDAKASVATMMQAVLELASEGYTPPNGQVMVALTTCEETGGIDNGMEALRPHLPPVHAALIGEPTELQPCVAQKGLLILNIDAHGKTAHAARAHLGDNALYHAARDLLRVESMTFHREDPFLGKPTITATTIEGGTARNVVPDRCRFTLDIRSTPAYTHEELTAMVGEALSSGVSIRSARIIPVSTPADARIVQACLKAQPGAEPFGSPTASDWIFLADVPAVKIGPGQSALSHTPQEHVPVTQLIQGVAVYKRIIRAYFEESSS